MDLLEHLTTIRATRPAAIAEALSGRRRRSLLSEHGTMFLIAADHPARGVVRAGGDPRAMADRGDFLRRIVVALDRPGVDGLMASPDVIEDLVLLGALDDRVVFGCMNRGGLGGAVYELDDRFTAYSAAGIEAARLDGGKMMVRLADDTADALDTLCACAGAIDALAERGLPAMVEVFASELRDGRARNLDDPDSLIRAIGVVSGLGQTSAYTWLKLPVVEDMARVMASTTLPTVLLGGDPGADAEATYARWREAMALPQVRGLVAGRTLLYPGDGDVAAAVDEAVSIVAAARPGASGVAVTEDRA
jgi:hypothetical protein